VVSVAAQPNLILLPGPGQPGQEIEQPREPLRSDEIPASPGPATSSSGWGGAAVLVVPTVGLFAMVAAVVVVNVVNHWWVLVPAMLMAMVTTACVVLTIIRMLADGDGS
jgi:hypothetical protein